MDQKNEIGKLLSTHGLKKTPIRTEILKRFMQNSFALSANDLAVNMTIENDRVTIYRTLSSFEAKGIIHRASESKNGIKYALCNQGHSHEAPTNEHVHFVCEACHQTICMEDVAVPKVQVAKEFAVHRVNYTIDGICPACSS